MRNSGMRPRGEVPLVFTPRYPDFVLQLAFGHKLLHMNFGLKPLKPGGSTLENVFFPVLLFYIFVAFYSLGFKLNRLLDWSMVYRSGNG